MQILGKINSSQIEVIDVPKTRITGGECSKFPKRTFFAADNEDF